MGLYLWTLDFWLFAFVIRPHGLRTRQQPRGQRAFGVLVPCGGVGVVAGGPQEGVGVEGEKVGTLGCWGTAAGLSRRWGVRHMYVDGQEGFGFSPSPNATLNLLLLLR